MPANRMAGSFWKMEASFRNKGGNMEKFEKRTLMPYKGCSIVKCWNLEDKTIKKGSVFYRAYMDNGKGSLCGTSRSLPELKRKIDNLMCYGNRISATRSYITQPKIRFGGGSIKWLDESQYMKEKI